MPDTTAAIRGGCVLAAAAVAAIALAGAVAPAGEPARDAPPRIELKSEEIKLPYGDALFKGLDRTAKTRCLVCHSRPVERGRLRGEVANNRCLFCHSREMVDAQPPLELEVWKAEVKKMRSAFGCRMPDDEVDELVRFLYHRNHLLAR